MAAFWVSYKDFVDGFQCTSFKLMHAHLLHAEKEEDNFVIQSWQADKQSQFKNT